jgi:hypothetical protein
MNTSVKALSWRNAAFYILRGLLTTGQEEIASKPRLLSASSDPSPTIELTLGEQVFKTHDRERLSVTHINEFQFFVSGLAALHHGGDLHGPDIQTRLRRSRLCG